MTYKVIRWQTDGTEEIWNTGPAAERARHNLRLRLYNRRLRLKNKKK